MAYNPYRSRLQKVEEQRSFRRSLLFVFLSIVIVGTLIFVGIPLLTGVTSLFGGDSGSDLSKDNIPPAPPQLFVPYSATNSATLILRGRAEVGATVYVSRNSTVIGNQIANDQGEFSLENVALVDGQNQFIAVAVDPSGNKSLQSPMASIQYSTSLPKLEIYQPTDGQIVHGVNSSFEVKGMTDTGNKLMVNDRFLILTSQGNFSTQVLLNEGENTIVIVATNPVGNITRKEIKAIYAP